MELLLICCDLNFTLEISRKTIVFNVLATFRVFLFVCLFFGLNMPDNGKNETLLDVNMV